MRCLSSWIIGVVNDSLGEETVADVSEEVVLQSSLKRPFLDLVMLYNCCSVSIPCCKGDVSSATRGYIGGELSVLSSIRAHTWALVE